MCMWVQYLATPFLLAKVPKIYNRYGAVVSPRTIKKLAAKTPTMTLEDIMKHRPLGNVNIGNA